VEAGGFSSTCRQMVMLPGFEHVTGVGGFAQETGEGEFEFGGIWVGSRFEAHITVSIAYVTEPGEPVTGQLVTVPSGAVVSPHVAHDARAAVMAPCCAACWMVE